MARGRRVLIHFLLGFAIGAGSSVLPGPCNLAVVGATLRHGMRRAIGTGLGTAIADTSYAGVGAAGLAPLLARQPGLAPLLQAISGLALIVYGLLNALAPPPPVAAAVAAPAAGDGHLRRGVAVGFTLVITNPASIITWGVIVASLLGGASAAQAWSAAAGIGCGGLAWYALLAITTRRGHSLLGDRVHRITAVAGCLLAAYGVLCVARAAHLWLVG